MTFMAKQRCLQAIAPGTSTFFLTKLTLVQVGTFQQRPLDIREQIVQRLLTGLCLIAPGASFLSNFKKKKFTEFHFFPLVY
jgi:hypothetical protein